jgi:hypothetical protein
MVAVRAFLDICVALRGTVTAAAPVGGRTSAHARLLGKGQARMRK